MVTDKQGHYGNSGGSLQTSWAQTWTLRTSVWFLPSSVQGRYRDTERQARVAKSVCRLSPITSDHVWQVTSHSVTLMMGQCPSLGIWLHVICRFLDSTKFDMWHKIWVQHSIGTTNSNSWAFKNSGCQLRIASNSNRVAIWYMMIWFDLF